MKKRWALLLALILLTAAGADGSREATPTSGGVPGTVIWIELDRKRLTVYEGGQEKAVFPIASGARGTPSPIGVFQINGRFATELSGFGTRFLSLNVPWGQYGIHGTNNPASIGQNASHGCIRMRVKDAERLYAMAPTGTKVVIESGPYGAADTLRTLREGDRGGDVMLLQRRLIQRGFLSGSSDGVFGPATRLAVIAARKALNLPVSDAADGALYAALGIIQFE